MTTQTFDLKKLISFGPKRGLFRAGIALALANGLPEIRDKVRALYRSYLYAYYRGNTDDNEAARRELWSLLGSEGFLTQAYNER